MYCNLQSKIFSYCF